MFDRLALRRNPNQISKRRNHQSSRTVTSKSESKSKRKSEQIIERFVISPKSTEGKIDFEIKSSNANDLESIPINKVIGKIGENENEEIKKFD